MNAQVSQYLDSGEGISVEFKRCGNQPGQDVFETICSFANRQGGNLLLGVLDDGTVEGIPMRSALDVERNIVNVVGNQKLFNVAPLVKFERLPVAEDRLVLRVWVPMGSSLYMFKGVVYDRKADADVRVTNDAQIAAMVVRKQNYYSERVVYPWLGKDDLELGLLADVREAVRMNRVDHPWLSLTDDELLRTARLYARDPLTGEYGFNLAAVMLLGREETILDIAPLYRTDAILRRMEVDRYDDRLLCRGNLVHAYDELVFFCEKWLPDSFVLDGAQRVSARSVIVRELVCNSLIHREFMSPHIARLVIDRKGIRTTNASRALYTGRVTLDTLEPTPKNPIIANFFTQMGRSEELGSGTRSLYKFSKLYTGAEPVLEDGDLFTAFVPIPAVAVSGSSSEDVSSSSHKGTRERIRAAVAAVLERSSSFPAAAIAAEVPDVSERTVRRYLSTMVKEGELASSPRGRSTTYSRA